MRQQSPSEKGHPISGITYQNIPLLNHAALGTNDCSWRNLKTNDFVKSRQGRRHSKKLQMQGARILRNEAYIEVRCNDER
jgi:hypothetical protein